MLPEAIDKRTLLAKYVNQSVALHKELETIKEDIAELSNMVEQEVGKDFVKELKILTQARLQQSKFIHEVGKKSTALEESEILKQYAK